MGVAKCPLNEFLACRRDCAWLVWKDQTREHMCAVTSVACGERGTIPTNRPTEREWEGNPVK